jgi:hypothetical protein
VVGVTARVGVLEGKVVGGAVVVELADRDDCDGAVVVEDRRAGAEQPAAASATTATTAPRVMVFMGFFR